MCACGGDNLSDNLVYDGLLSMCYQEIEVPTQCWECWEERYHMHNGLFLGSRGSHNVGKKLMSTKGCSLVCQLVPGPFATFDACGCFLCVKTKREI